MPIIISTKGQQAVRLEHSPPQQENQLQQYISENPMALPIDEISGNSRLLVLAREFETHSGPIDVIAIDNRGSVYVIETKLYKNPDKRKVVAQVLDYGAALWKAYTSGEGFLNDLDSACLADGPGLRQRVATGFKLDDAGVAELLDQVKQNLAKGGIHFIVLMDKLHDRLRDLISFLNEKSRFNLYAVEMEFYHHEGLQIVIPRLFGAEVVKEVAGATDAQYQWDELRFIQDFGAAYPKLASEMKRLIDLLGEFSQLEFKNADFKGKHAKLNVCFAQLRNRPLFNVWSEDGTMTIDAEYVDKTESAAAFRQRIVGQLMEKGFCSPASPEDKGEIQIPPAVWVKQLDVLRDVLRKSS